MELRFVYITAKDMEEARKIGKMLVQEHLVACVNIFENMRSIYRWKGKVEEGSEAILIAKTQASLVPKIIERVKSLHSYECPCIVTFPILEGNPEYLAWVEHETQS